MVVGIVLRIACLIALALPQHASAQGNTLVVTLHDVRGQPLRDIAVSLRDTEGAVLEEQRTGDDGAVTFRTLELVVRIAVRGQPRSGPALYHLGADSQGIRVALDQGTNPTVVNLRAEDTGLVLPDPATMLSLDLGGPTVVAPLPSAIIATPAPLPTRMPALPTSNGAPPDDVPVPGAGWVPLVTLLVIGLCVAALRLIQRRRETR